MTAIREQKIYYKISRREEECSPQEGRRGMRVRYFIRSEIEKWELSVNEFF